MAGQGTRPKKALRASQIITLESFPSDQRMAMRLRRANASRRMKTLCDSNSSRRSSCVTSAVLAADGWPEARTVSFLVSTLIFLLRSHSQLVEYFSICPQVRLCIWQIILVNPQVPQMDFMRQFLRLLRRPLAKVRPGVRQRIQRSDRSVCALASSVSGKQRSGLSEDVALELALPPSFGI
jgi:hypothetical protein